MKRNHIGDINGKRILFLQGPMGSFFKNLDIIFRKEGAKTYKIGFNAGDSFFSCRDNYVPFRKKRRYWSAFCDKFLKEYSIDQIYLFGDCRYYQREAIKVAIALHIEVFVFEEGYIRPDYITLEKYGVNDFSHIPREWEFYDALDLDNLVKPEPKPTNPSQLKMCLSAIIYYTLSNLLFFMYPHYKHHRDFLFLKEVFYGIRNFIRKSIYKWTEKHYLGLITGECSKQYYFVPLQTHNDFQVLTHSQYASLEKCIIEVLESFAKHAPKDSLMLFKHHPVDRGRKNYHDFITNQAHVLGVAKRICIVHDVHLPTCLKHAIGTVTINSTVGLSSIYHQIPVITLGKAIYDIKGLTCKGMKLDDFWTSYTKPDKELFQKYRRFIIHSTQLNGSFYGKMPEFQY